MLFFHFLLNKTPICSLSVFHNVLRRGGPSSAAKAQLLGRHQEAGPFSATLTVRKGAPRG